LSQSKVFLVKRLRTIRTIVVDQVCGEHGLRRSRHFSFSVCMEMGSPAAQGKPVLTV